ncbi:MAG: hypothetical protein WCR31_05785, partial [Treponema sp.]
MREEKNKKRPVFILAAACVFFCASGCSNLLNKNSGPTSESGPVTVSVAASVGGARAAYPSALTGITKLQVTAEYSSAAYDPQTVTVPVTDGTAGDISFLLIPGSWTITVNGIYSDGTNSTVLVTGSKTAAISANNASTVAVILTPVSTGTQTTVTTGNAALSFYDGDNLGFTQVTAALYSDGTDMKGTSSAATIDGKSCYTYSLSGYRAG